MHDIVLLPVNTEVVSEQTFVVLGMVITVTVSECMISARMHW